MLLRMKIEVPVRGYREAVELLAAGADILYGALAPQFYSNAAGAVSRRAWQECNIFSLQDLKAICQLVKEKNKKFYLALNEHFYNEEQLQGISAFLKINKFIKNIIIADLGLVLFLRKNFPKLNIIASVGTHVFNSAAVSFYENLGVKEIVLPREITAEEVVLLKNSAAQISFSYIIKNDDCPNIDGLCAYSHGIYDGSGPCTDLYNIVCKDRISEDVVEINDYNFRSRQNCKVCQLKSFAQAGLDIVKIAGRGSSLKKLVQDIDFLKQAIGFLKYPEQQFLFSLKNAYRKSYNCECLVNCQDGS